MDSLARSSDRDLALREKRVWRLRNLTIYGPTARVRPGWPMQGLHHSLSSRLPAGDLFLLASWRRACRYGQTQFSGMNVCRPIRCPVVPTLMPCVPRQPSPSRLPVSGTNGIRKGRPSCGFEECAKGLSPCGITDDRYHASCYTPTVFANPGTRRARVACSKAWPSPINRPSLYAGPTKERPTGRPLTKPAGTVRCG